MKRLVIVNVIVYNTEICYKKCKYIAFSSFYNTLDTTFNILYLFRFLPQSAHMQAPELKQMANVNLWLNEFVFEWI